MFDRSETSSAAYLASTSVLLRVPFERPSLISSRCSMNAERS